MRFALPAAPSPAVLLALLAACRELERAGPDAKMTVDSREYFNRANAGHCRAKITSSAVMGVHRSADRGRCRCMTSRLRRTCKTCSNQCRGAWSP